MKLNVTVDLEDLYQEDCDGNILEAVKRELTTSIVHETKKQVEKQINDMLDVCVRKTITNKIGELTNKIMLQKFDENAMIVTDTYSKKEEPIKDFVSKSFAENFARYSMSNVIKRECERIGDELKNRYDMQFAALIVDNLRKQRLLSDDRIAELLMKK